MSAFRASFFLILTSVLCGCAKDDPAPQASSASASASELPLPPSRFAATGWPEDAGPIVVLPGSNPQEARVVLPELTDKTLSDTSSFDLDSLPRSAVVLFAQSQPSTPATITGGGSEETVRGCKTWPTARLGSYPGNRWRFGLAENSARDLPLSGWGASLATDSTQAVQDLIRIASTGARDSVFSGIPFAIRFLYRIEIGKTRVLIADAVRRINTEANVREQHSLIIAERANGSSRYEAAYRETQSGREDDVRVPELLGAVLLGENLRPAVFVSLEHSDGMRLLLLERQRSGLWTLRWRSAYTGC